MARSQNFLQNLQAEHEHQNQSSKNNIQYSGTLLGIDYGEKHTGLAIYENGVILPLEILLTDNRSLTTQLDQICKERKANQVVWGLPLGVNGEENHICDAIKKLSQKLHAKNKLPFELINERYSSQMTLDNKGSRKDDLAAMRILEFYLDMGIIES